MFLVKLFGLSSFKRSNINTENAEKHIFKYKTWLVCTERENYVLSMMKVKFKQYFAVVLIIMVYRVPLAFKIG